jgi:hypothetical protein
MDDKRRLPDSGQVLIALRRLLGDVGEFSRALYPRQALRPYQVEVAQALVSAIRRNMLAPGEAGPNQFAVVFSRQAGKDETTAQLLAYLLNIYRLIDAKVVMAAPTQRQATISRDRLCARLDSGLSRGWWSRHDYIVRMGQAEVRFLSAAPTSNARGETASLLLVANEAQDIEIDRWDAVFDPMAASTNAVTLFLGTVWTSNTTLLARQMRHLRELEAQDGFKRVWLVDWEQVAKYVPAYGERVKSRIAQFGENHPFIQTEYFLKELDGNGGLFGAERRALMVGSHPRRESAEAGKIYALLVDVAGENEAGLGG